MPTKQRSACIKKAYYYYYSYRKSLSVKEVTNPVSGKTETRILFEYDSARKQVIALCILSCKGRKSPKDEEENRQHLYRFQ